MPARNSAINLSPPIDSSHAGDGSGSGQEEGKQADRNRTRTIYASQPDKNLSPDSFKILKIVGRGTFGKVSLV
jgi:hypothetical protein